MDQTAGLLGIYVLSREGPAVVVDTRTPRVLGQLLKANLSNTRLRNILQRLQQLHQLIVINRLHEMAIEPGFL